MKFILNKESEMFISTKFIGKKILLLSALIMIGMALLPSRATAGEGSCLESGMTVSNQTMRDLWVRGNGGRCFLWRNHHLLKLKPGATVVIYRDINCQTEYCPMSITFDSLMLLDLDQNCRVRVLPDCNLSDM
jgi:hypothetical protein